jgi:hypothetical protein
MKLRFHTLEQRGRGEDEADGLTCNTPVLDWDQDRLD